MTTSEKVAYLKGLAEGLAVDANTPEGKLFTAIIDVLEDIALDLEDLWDNTMELTEGLDVVSEDLEDVEDIIYDEEDEDDEDDDEYYEDELDEDEDCYATTCPTCEEEIFFDETILEDGVVVCPNCGEKLEFDLSSIEEEEVEIEE